MKNYNKFDQVKKIFVFDILSASLKYYKSKAVMYYECNKNTI